MFLALAQQIYLLEKAVLESLVETKRYKNKLSSTNSTPNEFLLTVVRQCDWSTLSCVWQDEIKRIRVSLISSQFMIETPDSFLI